MRSNRAPILLIGMLACSLSFIDSSTAADNARVTGGSATGGSVTGGSVTGGSVKGGDVRGGDVKGGDVTGGSVTGGSVTGGNVTGGAVTGGSATAGAVTSGTVSSGTATASIGGREIKAMAKSASIQQTGEAVTVRLDQYTVLVEKNRVLLNSKELATLPADAAKVELEMNGGELTVRADGKEVLKSAVK